MKSYLTKLSFRFPCYGRACLANACMKKPIYPVQPGGCAPHPAHWYCHHHSATPKKRERRRQRRKMRKILRDVFSGKGSESVLDTAHSQEVSRSGGASASSSTREA